MLIIEREIDLNAILNNGNLLIYEDNFPQSRLPVLTFQLEQFMKNQPIEGIIIFCFYADGPWCLTAVSSPIDLDRDAHRSFLDRILAVNKLPPDDVHYGCFYRYDYEYHQFVLMGKPLSMDELPQYLQDIFAALLTTRFHAMFCDHLTTIH